MKLNKIQLIAVGVAALVIISAFAVYLHTTNKLEEYTTTNTTAREGDNLLIVSDSSPFYPLIATPVAAYYTQGNGSAERHVRPLLVQDPSDPSTAISQFLEAYSGPKDAAIIGDASPAGYPIDVMENFSGSPTKVSRAVAEHYWSASPNAMIIRPDREGYAPGVSAVVLASYLNMPVLVAKDLEDVYGTMRHLGVGTIYTCGDVKGDFFGTTIRLKSPEQIRTLTLQTLSSLGMNATYIAMANPADSPLFEPEVKGTKEYHFEGIVNHTETGSSANPGDSNAKAPRFYFEIPKDYQWARVTVDTKMELVSHDSPVLNSDTAGDRIYTYIGEDHDHDGVILHDDDSPNDELNFFVPSLAYGYYQDEGTGMWYAWGHTTRPMFNVQGEHSVQVLASLPSLQNFMTTPSAKFRITITVEKLSEPNFALMPGLSEMASYLAAVRGGVVLAQTDFSVYSPTYLKHEDCGSPDTNPDVQADANNHTGEVKAVLNNLLGEIAGLPSETKEDILALADYYANRSISNPVYLGIIADTNMVPWYYYLQDNPYENQYGYYEGFSTPGDLFYSDIDSTVLDAPTDLDGSEPSMELPVGRVNGWDVQDVSALLARTFFYYNIIDHYSGLYGSSWKDSALASFGSEPPVESAATAVGKCEIMWDDAGFVVDSEHNNELARRQAMASLYSESNQIFICAHGFYYWYVPSAQESLLTEGSGGTINSTAAGGAFDVAHVKDMQFGPSIIYLSSCVTGKTDGIPGRNALSQAFLHAGMNSYLGASRLSWGSLIPLPDSHADEHFGDYLGTLYYAFLTGGVYYDKQAGELYMPYENLTIGQGFLAAKNKYIEDEGTDGGGPNSDTIEEFNLYGDPAFNPYEPNHNG